MAYPMLSPTMAPEIAATMAATSETRPWKASTPLRMQAISPRNRKPMKAEAQGDESEDEQQRENPVQVQDVLGEDAHRSIVAVGGRSGRVGRATNALP